MAVMPSPAELRLLEDLRAGDEASFARLVDLYGASMLRIARSIVGSRSIAEEVVQEAWLGVLRGIDRFEGRSSLKTWISGIVINLARARRRKEARVLTFTSLFGDLAERRTPTVDPARFGRVVAACGVMPDQRPYADLSMNLLAGNYGPADKMQTAVAAYTPNVPWARFGGSKIVDWDGNGTSAATPQIAAAAALWIQKNRKEYEKYLHGWQRVEAVRAALFEKAKIDANYAKFFGRGKLAAKDMLDAAPAPANRARSSMTSSRQAKSFASSSAMPRPRSSPSSP